MSTETAQPLEHTRADLTESTPHLQPDTENQPTTSLNHERTPNQQQQPATSLREVCADINNRVTRFLSATPTDKTTRSTQEQTKVATSVISQALRDYNFTALSLSYNGGKDCLVLLILYLSVLHTHFTQPHGRRKEDSETPPEQQQLQRQDHDESASKSGYFPSSIPSIYAKPPDPFDAVTSFVDSSTAAYHLDLTHISTNPGPDPKAKSHSSPPPSNTATTNSSSRSQPHETTPQTNGANSQTSGPIITFRDAFAMYLDSQPTVQAIFVGTRRTDPHGGTLSHFQMTDGNWPRFMRVHPVIDWRLSEIWCFLRSGFLADPRTGETLEYCTMYDEGYTSLGGVGDTLRNPKLRYVGEDGVERYRPAHEMTEDEEERAGRE